MFLGFYERGKNMTNERIFEADIILALMPEYIGIDISDNTHIKITAFRRTKMY